MAEDVTAFFRSSIANNLSKAVIQEAVLLSDVENRVEWIDRELRLIQASLEHVERTTEQGFIEWAEELKRVALQAEDVIETFNISSSGKRRRRSWIFFLADRHDIGKDLERIRDKIIDISQKGIKFYQISQQQQSRHKDMEKGVVIETPEEEEEEEASASRALEKLSGVVSENLENRDLKEILEGVRDDVVMMQKIMSNMRSTEQPWLKEVDEVCGSAIRVIEELRREREEWCRMGWYKHLDLHFPSYASERMFMEEMRYVKTQTGGVLQKGLTHGIGKEEGVTEKREPTSTMKLVQDVKELSTLFLPALKALAITGVTCYIVYVTIFRLLDIWHLSPSLVLLSLAFIANVTLTIPVIVDLREAKPGERMNKLDIFASQLLTYCLSYSVSFQWALLLLLFNGFVLSLVWVINIKKYVDTKMEFVQRELPLIHAILECGEGENERQRIWINQVRVVAEQANPLVAEYKLGVKRYIQFGAFKSLFMQLHRLHVLSNVATDMFHKVLNIFERETLYRIPRIEKREGLFSSGQSTSHGRGGELHDHDDSGAEEEPLLPAAGSNNCQLTVKGHLQRQVESIREDWQLMKALFKDAKEMGELDDRCKIWVDDMRDIALEIEHVNKEYASNLEGKPIHIHIWNYWARYFIVNKINQIRNEIQDASRRRKAYGLFGLQARAESTSMVQQSQPLDTMNLRLYQRRCLFYFVLFPAELKIPARRLVALWVAEGLVHQVKDKDTPEQVAERCLKELIELKLVQIVEKKPNGEVDTCRLRDDLREKLTKPNATESYLLPKNSTIDRVIDKCDPNDPWNNDIHNDILIDSAALRTSYKDVVSLISFDTQEGSKPGQEIGKFLDRCISIGCFLLLRVLDLEGVYKPHLPANIGKLSRLRYLGLRWTYLESLPSSVSNLLKLQTLDLEHTYISTLTSSIWKMELRHLFLSETYRTRFPPQPKGNYLSNLQTLSGLFVDEKTPVKGGLDKLINIRKLGLSCQSMSPESKTMTSQLVAVGDWIMKLEHLESLSLKSRDEKGKPWNLHLKSLKNHKRLTNIYLLGRIDNSSILSQFPTSLIELTLSHSNLEDDPMQSLKDLENLQSLSLLAESYMGKNLECKSGDFPQLHVLKLWRLKQLEQWNIEKEALTSLEELEVRSCASLKMLPDGLQHVSTLKEFKLTGMPMEIMTRVRNPDGEDWHKVSHIPLSIKSEGETCSWKCPPTGWACLNSNGSVIDNSKHACGGLIRDEAGLVLGCFSANLGVNSVNLGVTLEIAELWGIMHGLNYAWKMGLKKVSVDIDSQSALSLIKSSSSHDNHPTSAVIQGIGDVLERDWIVEFCHIYPEANRAASILANMGHDQPLGVLQFNSPPNSLAHVIRDDQAGVLYERRDP